MTIDNFFDSLKTLENIQKLVETNQEETDHFDFVQADIQFGDRDKSENIAKMACAMANSGGGIIVYGIKTDRSTPERAIEITGVHDRNSAVIESVLKTQVTPYIVGWNKWPIYGGGKLVTLVVKIPNSDLVPHQSVYDKLFYGRQSVASQPLTAQVIDLLYNKRRERLQHAPIVFVEKFRGGSDILASLLIRNKGTSPAINVVAKLNNVIIAEYPCLGANDTCEWSNNLREKGVKKFDNADNEFEITYRDIIGASYRVTIRGDLSDWWVPRPGLRLYKEELLLIQ